MRNPLNFARLDLITVKPYLTIKNFIILSVFITITGYFNGNVFSAVGMLMVLGAIYSSYPFAVGDRNGIDTLYATLPLNRSDVVLGRYIFALFLNVATGFLGFAISFVLSIALGNPFNPIETVVSILICFLLFSLVEAMQLPIYFKLGYTKAKMLAYLPLIGFPAAVFAVTSLFDKENFLAGLGSAFEWMNANRVLTLTVIAIVWLCAFALSCTLSRRYYLKRDF